MPDCEGAGLMPRLMSVAYTEQAVRERRKTVTRRRGWLMLKPGDHLTLVRKAMGRKQGEPLVRIVEVEVVSVRREPLTLLLATAWPKRITYDYAVWEMEREGFPGMDPREFVQRFFVEAQGMEPDAEVTRIEFRYVCSALSCECGGCVQ